jgi:hypothetical protein
MAEQVQKTPLSTVILYTLIAIAAIMWLTSRVIVETDPVLTDSTCYATDSKGRVQKVPDSVCEDSFGGVGVTH